MKEITKEILEYLIKHRITVTAEHPPGVLNGEVDWESQNIKNSREWLLNP